GLPTASWEVDHCPSGFVWRRGFPMRRDGSGAVEGRRSDLVRAVALLAAVVLQAVAGAIGGSGAWGEPVGSVANSYPTLILPGGGAFSIWTLIYVLSIVLAVRAAPPRQRRREVHRGVGWWLVAAGVLNAAWVVAFTQRWLVLAEAIIVALLVVLCTAWVKVTGHPAGGWADRLLLHTPIGVYVGWVGVATVSGGCGEHRCGVGDPAALFRVSAARGAGGTRDRGGRRGRRGVVLRGPRFRRRRRVGSGVDRGRDPVVAGGRGGDRGGAVRGVRGRSVVLAFEGPGSGGLGLSVGRGGRMRREHGHAQGLDPTGRTERAGRAGACAVCECRVVCVLLFR